MPKITDLDVQFISLVKRPANGRGIILRGATSGAREFAIAKADPMLKRVYGIVYAPDSVDAQGDWTDAETIRRAADVWMQTGRSRNVDAEHDFTPLPAFVAESWLVKSGDPLFPDEKPGAWAVGIQIDDAALWDAIEAGEVEGLSLAGTARLEKMANRIKQFFTRKETDEMDATEIKRIVKDVLAETVSEAEDQAQREKLEKAAEEARAEVAALKAQLADALKALDEAKARIESIEKAAPGKPAEGNTATGAPASFI
ncbi:putative serine protease XkdF [Sulfuritortus calidifontis]|uniref:Putative serine protease XkdF n=1 Tax=Sulfuritortus calidifontis TaxID=1914471 RepID=A0A4R3JTJ0_9PROT|nr:XkdF-like putative serine protease domain-containing protein [Sulfuritortus calidifontis]TCS70761.1 putative serine protease XkdF [Sulfuritortus calidifontis]